MPNLVHGPCCPPSSTPSTPPPQTHPTPPPHLTPLPHPPHPITNLQRLEPGLKPSCAPFCPRDAYSQPFNHPALLNPSPHPPPPPRLPPPSLPPSTLPPSSPPHTCAPQHLKPHPRLRPLLPTGCLLPVDACKLELGASPAASPHQHQPGQPRGQHLTLSGPDSHPRWQQWRR